MRGTCTWQRLTVEPVDAEALGDGDDEHGEAGRVVVHQLQHVHATLPPQPNKQHAAVNTCTCTS